VSTARVLRIAGALAGIVLFIYALQAAGLQTVAEGIRKTGFAFIWILLLSLIRFVIRSIGWRLCVQESDRLGFKDAFEAFIAGDAVGNLTFFGPVASEGTKALMARRQLSTVAVLSSIAIENIFYALSVAVMVVLGSAVFLTAFQTNFLTRLAGFATGIGATALGVVALLLLYRNPGLLTTAVDWMIERTSRFGLHKRVESIRDLEDRIHRFATLYPMRVPQVLATEFLFHAGGIAEIYLLLMVLAGGAPRVMVLQAVVLETVNRLITIVFKFVPMRVGVDEAGSGLATQVLALSSGVGVTMAVVRKARTLVWAAIGLIVLVRRGIPSNP